MRSATVAASGSIIAGPARAAAGRVRVRAAAGSAVCRGVVGVLEVGRGGGDL
jgi:hypothetical protein